MRVHTSLAWTLAACLLGGCSVTAKNGGATGAGSGGGNPVSSSADEGIVDNSDSFRADAGGGIALSLRREGAGLEGGAAFGPLASSVAASAYGGGRLPVSLQRGLQLQAGANAGAGGAVGGAGGPVPVPATPLDAVRNLLPGVRR